ncbi:MAG: hypothetical protein EF813_04055 [Methanosarcinales archaeon]|nr:MAG: hypothetical protein EF813_04055 [Methanosarcinales archaeon]
MSVHSMILTFIVIVVCVTGASAGTANTVTIKDVTLQPGATQEVPIRLLGSTGVSGVRVTLTFSTSIVNVTNVVAGNFTMFTFDYAGVNNGVLKVTTMKSGSGLTGDLILATITLGAVGDGGSGELGLQANLTDQSGNAVTSSVDGGTLTVGTGAAILTSPLTSSPSPSPSPTAISSATTTTTTTTNTAAPAASTTRSATTQTTTTPVTSSNETTPDAPVKNKLSGFKGIVTVAGLFAATYVVMRRRQRR